MATRIRRVITGHDDNGRAICVSDATATNHAWSNRGRETCRIAFVLVDAVAKSTEDES